MKLKKIAGRGLVVVAIAVALCMFFAGTVRTITTAKVKLVSTRRGKLEQTINLEAKLFFPSTVDYRVEGASELTLLVDKVNVRVGYQVKAGDVLFTATATDYGEKMEKLTADYDAALQKLNDLDMTNRSLDQSAQRYTWYAQALALQESIYRKRVALHVLALKENVSLPDAQWGENGEDLWQAAAQAAGASEDLNAAISAYNEEQTALAEVEAQLENSYKFGRYDVSDETWKYIVERNGYLETMAELENQMVDLELLRDRLTTVYAPSDGYVTAINVKNGETYDGKAAAYTMSAPDVAPVLRAEITEVKQAIASGASVSVKSDYSEIKTSVQEVRMDADGKKYALIEITPELISLKGSIYGMSLADTQATITYRASDATTLLPASAVRNDGSTDYVFVVDMKWGAFTGQSMYVTKTTVTVLARSDTMVSIAEEIYNSVADKEDRPIEDGNTVMEFVS